MSLKLEPVAWLTVAAVAVGAVLEADQEFHVLPTSWGHWLAFAALALGLIVAGVKTRAVVTPLAQPQDNAGVPLVPKFAADPPPPDLPNVPPAAWQPQHRAEGQILMARGSSSDTTVRPYAPRDTGVVIWEDRRP